MMLSFPRMFGLFNGQPHPRRPLTQPTEAPDHQQQHAKPLLAAESPSFLHPGFAPFEPDLTNEIRQVLGEDAARRAGDVP